MKVLHLKMDNKGARQILQSEAVRADLEARAQRIAAAAGPGFEADATVGRTRALARVQATTDAAREAEATSRALTRAIDAGR